MNTLFALGQRQQILLKALLHTRNGLTVDKLAARLDISRNAVNQHLSSLETNALVHTTSMTSTGGRPSKVYTLTEKGVELFPKHYALFSNLLMRLIKQKFGEDELKACVQELGEGLANEFKARMDQCTSTCSKITELTAIMYELGYETSVSENTERSSEIIASNCVFHKLAEESNEVCQLDLSLMSSLLGNDAIEHKECIVNGGKCCRFKITHPQLS